jgi:hypothetical protein
LRQRVGIQNIKAASYSTHSAHGLVASFWHLTVRTAMGSAHCAINAAAPGLDKSLVDIALLVIANHLADMWEEVDKDRRARGGKHLPALRLNEKLDLDL